MKNNDKRSLIIHIRVIHHRKAANTRIHMTGQRNTEQNATNIVDVNEDND